MLAVGENPLQEALSITVLQDQVGEASSIPVPDLPEDILLDDQDTLLSTPTPSR